MPSIFTEHVRHFRSTSDPAGDVLGELEKLLRQRMRRRGLLSAPQSYLGYGPGSWNAKGAFDDIVVDCYVFAVLKRLDGLRNQLQVRDNIDGLIIRNVDNFLLERQRRSDPVGYAVFGNVDAAARRAEELGELANEGRKHRRLNNAAVLRLDPSRPDAEVVDLHHLDEVLEEAPGRDEAVSLLVATTDEAQEWVCGFLRRLAAAGVAALRFGDLCKVLAVRARATRAALHAAGADETALEGDDELSALVWTVQPDLSVEERDRWEMLKVAVPRRIEGLDRQERVRERLKQVFAALVELVEEGNATPPKQAEVMARLGVARATLSDDFHLLRDVIEGLIREENPDS